MIHNHYIPLAATLIPGLIAYAISPASEPPTDPASTLLGMPLLFSDDFEENSESKWDPTDAKAWIIIQQNGNHVCLFIGKQELLGQQNHKYKK